MYEFSRAIYRELAPSIRAEDAAGLKCAHEKVLRACEETIERLAADRHYFARPARSLFRDIRTHFPVGIQHRVYQVIEYHLDCADDHLLRQPRSGFDAAGNPLECRATTRKGTPCQRVPLPQNGYCPSHQHLAETEDMPAEVLAA